jgi:hypothetical protein
MIPPGKTDINPAVNAIQAIVLVSGEGGMLIEHFQNTPAAFHGRPELGEQLTSQLNAIAKSGLVLRDE